MGIGTLDAAHGIGAFELAAHGQNQVDEVGHRAVVDIGQAHKIQRVEPLQRLVPVRGLLGGDIAEEHRAVDSVALHHVVEALGARRRRHALGQRPCAKRRLVGSHVVAVDAATSAALAIVARQRSDERVAVTGHVVVAELVDAAHAVVYDGGAGRILLGHIGHHLGGNVAGLSGPFQGIGLHVLAKARELGHIALAVYGELAFQRRDRTLGGMGHCRVRRFVPHIKGLQLHRLAGFRIGARHHVG